MLASDIEAERRSARRLRSHVPEPRRGRPAAKLQYLLDDPGFRARPQRERRGTGSASIIRGTRVVDRLEAIYADCCRAPAAAAPHRPPCLTRMRLLIGNKFWYPKGGVETYLFELIEELPACGYDVIPFAMKHARNLESAYSDFFVDEVDYHAPQPLATKIRMAARMLYSRHAAAKLAALLDAHPPRSGAPAQHLSSTVPGHPAVARRAADSGGDDAHDLKLACPNYKMRTDGEICERCIAAAIITRCCTAASRGRSPPARCARSSCSRTAAAGSTSDNVDRFIVPSRFYLQKMIEAGLPASKLEWIPSFTHVERYTPSYGGDDYFVYVGRLSDEKGIPTLIEAVRGFNKGRLLIVGEGPLRGRARARRAADRLENVRVRRTEMGNRARRPDAGRTLLGDPSEWYENCPRSCIESFACGTPVIGANIGGIPEMIDDRETGLLFTPFSAADLRDKIEYLFEQGRRPPVWAGRRSAKAEREYSAQGHLDRLLARVSRGVLAGEPDAGHRVDVQPIH